MQEYGRRPEDSSILIRSMQPAEDWYLRVALLTSIHVAEGEAAPDESILQEPPFAASLEKWGREGDIAVVAVDQRRAAALIGTAWVRVYTADRPTYGYVADDIPVLALSVSADYRGKGVGTRLLASLVDKVRSQGYSAISLSVDPNNRAIRLYRRFGFEETHAPRIIANDENPVMLLRL